MDTEQTVIVHTHTIQAETFGQGVHRFIENTDLPLEPLEHAI